MHTRGAWTAHSLAKIFGYSTHVLSTDSRMHRNMVADFQLDRAEPNAGQIRRQIGCFFFFFFLWKSLSSAKFHIAKPFLGRVCQGTLYSLACEYVASHHLIEPCQSRSQGDSTVCLCRLLAGP